MTLLQPPTCPRCGVAVQCGMVNGDSQCWCFTLPHIAALPASNSSEEARCLCPACLQALMDSHDLQAPAN